MLQSSLFSGSADLNDVAAGNRRILAPEVSDSVALIQEALVAIGISLPTNGIDDAFGSETGTAVSNFKADRNVLPSDPVVGVGTITRLDLELSYLEGTVADPAALDATTLSLDPFFAGVLEVRFANAGISQKVIDQFQFGDRLCFRPSFLFDPLKIVAKLGEFLEQRIFSDFCLPSRRGPCSTDDFFDATKGSTQYVDFLFAHNPQADPARIGELATIRRPDMLTHRAPQEWWEIKPFSIAGAIAARVKLNDIIPAYAARGLPYQPGESYTPTPDILIASFITDQGEKLDLVLNVEQEVPGLLFWQLCVKGDYVLYFNRVRLAVGIAAILAAAAEVLAPAAEAGAIVAAIQELAQELSLGVLPLLTSRQ